MDLGDNPLAEQDMGGRTHRAREFLDEVAQYIPRDSPFFRLYTGTPTLDQILNIGDAVQRPVDFSEAVRALWDVSGKELTWLTRYAEIGDETTLTRIKNRHLGHKLAKGNDVYADTRFAPMTSGHLFSLTKASDDKTANFPGRLALFFYDEGGRLVLRKDFFQNAESKEQGYRYLAGTHQLNEFLEYLSGIFSDRYGFEVESGGTHLGALGKKEYLRRRLLNVKKSTHLSARLKRLCPSLHLTPIYLLMRPTEVSVRDSSEKIREHIASTYRTAVESS